MMPDLTQEPAYYSELETPPARARMLPDATGYISTSGQIIYYGVRPKEQPTCEKAQVAVDHQPTEKLGRGAKRMLRDWYPGTFKSS